MEERRKEKKNRGELHRTTKAQCRGRVFNNNKNVTD